MFFIGFLVDRDLQIFPPEPKPEASTGACSQETETYTQNKDVPTPELPDQGISFGICQAIC